MQCHVCGGDGAFWLYPLFPDRLRYRRHGKGYVRHHELMLCDECRVLWDSGDDAGLTERLNDPFEIALLRQAAASAIPAWYDDTLPPGVTSLRREGFVPIEELTGMHEVVEFWPAEHRQSLPEIRPCWLGDGATEFWMVRAPSGDLHDYLAVLLNQHRGGN